MKILACFFILLLAGCAPKCQKASFWNGGYQEFQVNNEEYILTYKEGLISEKNDSVKERIIALRAAEIALKKGFTHFDMKRGRTPQTVHVYCYTNEKTETAIDALAFSQKFSNCYPGKEHVYEIAVRGDI